VRERRYPAGLAETIARNRVELPVLAGGVQEARGYIRFVDYNMRTMVKAMTGG
jgi:hypothetical protein